MMLPTHGYAKQCINQWVRCRLLRYIKQFKRCDGEQCLMNK